MGEGTIDGSVSAMKGRLRAEPARGRVRYRAVVELSGGLRCDVRTKRHTLVVDEPPSVGGTDAGANPLEVVLAALASCQAITYRVWAGQRGVALERVSVEVAGDLDLRAYFGLDDEARPGFSDIDLRVTLEGPEPPERYRELAEAVDRHCPVLDALRVGAPVTRTLVEPAAVA